MNRDRALHILGLDAGASTDEARAAFRKAVKRLHPDARGGVPAAAFQEVLDAWRTIEAQTGQTAQTVRPAEPAIIECCVTVDAFSARTGAPVQVDTPCGKVRIPLPRRAVSGQRLRLSGMGKASADGARGDLIVILSVTPPPPLASALHAFVRDFSHQARPL